MSRWAWAGLAGLTGAAVLAVVAGALQEDISATEVVAVTGIGLLFIAAGAVAWARNPDSPTGRLMSAVGLTWMVSQALFLAGSDLLFTLGAVLVPLPLAFLAHLALVFPGGRRLSRFERAVVAMPYALAVLASPFFSPEDCDGPCPRNLVGIDPTDGAGRVFYNILLVAVLVVTMCFLAVLVDRWRRGSPAARRVLLPVIPGASVLAVVYAAGILAELGLPTGLGQRWGVAGLVLILVSPLALLLGYLRRHLHRVGVGELVVELGGSPDEHRPPEREPDEAGPGPDGPGGGGPGRRVRDALGRALGDPSVEVAYWLEEREAYVDADGRPFQVPVGDPDRAVTLIERNGARVGALVYDPALRDDPALVKAVSAATGLAMENARLHAEVLARLEEVRASRARIVEAADTARRRVERNLHDGAQQRLVAVSLALGMARARLGPEPDPELAALVSQASEEAASAVRDLRELARGLHPTVLTDSGLGPAVESLAERAPVPVEVCVRTDGRLPTPVETTAYYLVSEALTNVAKYANASSARVRIEQEPGRLVVEVTDDGVGGAEVHTGSGLEGLADRVAALEGRFEVESPPGQGTRLRAELPCG